MTSLFFPIKHCNVWISGLPRNDFLIKEFSSLPEYLQHQLIKIREVKKNKRLLIYAPTYRQKNLNNSPDYFQFSPQEIQDLRSILKENNAILGIRLHYFRNSSNLFNIEEYIDNEIIVDLGHTVISEIACVIREADIVISDYSSIFLDAIYLNKPVISFAYDLTNYKNNQDGLLYELELVFPGPIVRKSTDLFEVIQNYLMQKSFEKSPKYQFSQQLFYKYIDDKNSERVVNLVYSLIN